MLEKQQITVRVFDKSFCNSLNESPIAERKTDVGQTSLQKINLFKAITAQVPVFKDLGPLFVTGANSLFAFFARQRVKKKVNCQCEIAERNCI